MNSMMRLVLSLSVSGTLLLWVVWAVTHIGRRKFSKTWQYYVWLLVVLRLLVPFTGSHSLVGAAFEQFPAAVSSLPALATQWQGAGSVPAAAGDIRPLAADGAATQPEPGTGLVLTLLWGTVALALLGYKSRQYRQFAAAFCARHKAATDPALLNQLAAVCEELGIRAPVELYIDPQAPSPFVVGFFKPKIVLPSTKLPEEEIRFVFLHELTHYRRRDQWCKWLTQAALCIHWFNPLVYWLAHKANQTCELACDEAVIRRLGAPEARAYGSMLIGSLQHAGSKNRYILPGNALEQDARAVKERLEAIRAYQKKSKRVTIAAFAIAVALIGGAGALGAVVPGGALAEKPQLATEGLRVMLDEEQMLVDGENVFLYNSRTFDTMPSGMAVLYTHSQGESISGTPGNAGDTIVGVEVYDTGISGPFGIEVGMTAQTLLSLLPGANEQELEAEDQNAEVHPRYYYREGYEDGKGTLYTYSYQGVDGKIYTIEAYCLLDMVINYSVMQAA